MSKQTGNIRPQAREWLKANHGVSDSSVYTSKYYTPEESWTADDAWAFSIPIDALERVGVSLVHLVGQAAPHGSTFHYLGVPATFLREHLDGLALVGNKISLFLSAKPTNLFVDQRGSRAVSFARFLVR